MAKKAPPFNIVIPVYEHVDLMDVAAPFEIFNWMGSYWKERTVKVELAARRSRSIRTRDGMRLTPDRTFRDYNKQKIQVDLLWVPGGDPVNLRKTMEDSAYLGFLREQSERAAYVTSVCEGALLLASAGLLDGYTVTTHWAFIPCLKAFHNIDIAEGYPRYVVDRNRVTGGGISSGLDEALAIVALISSEAIAKQVQLVTQYFPKPPFDAEIPQSKACPLPDWPGQQQRS